MATVVETYLDNAIVSDAAYGDLNKNLTATDYVKALTDSRIGKPDMSTSQAKAFAGVIEAKDSNGNIITYIGDDGKEHVKYKFVTKDKKDINGNIIYGNDGKPIQERTKGYSVIETYTDPTTGYNGVLLKNNVTENWGVRALLLTFAKSVCIFGIYGLLMQINSISFLNFLIVVHFEIV